MTFYVIYQDLMPIHCCAMQGRIDAIQALLFFDTEGIIRQNLEMEGEVFRLYIVQILHHPVTDRSGKT